MRSTRETTNENQGIHLQPGRVHSDPHNFRGIGLTDTIFMVYQRGLRDTLLHHSLRTGLLTPSQGACQPRRQTLDTVYTLLSYISHQHEHTDTTDPTIVILDDIALAFPTVSRDQLLARLH